MSLLEVPGIECVTCHTSVLSTCQQTWKNQLPTPSGMAFLHPAIFIDLVARMETFDNETNIFIEAHLIWICVLCSGVCRRKIRDFEVVLEIPPIEVLSSAGLAHNTIMEHQLK